MKNVAYYIRLEADKENEKNCRPYDKRLKETLVMMGAVFSYRLSWKNKPIWCFFIIRAKTNTSLKVIQFHDRRKK